MKSTKDATPRASGRRKKKPPETGWRHVTYMVWGYTKLVSGIALKFFTGGV